MPRPRTPRAKAAITGQDLNHKSRYFGRNEPIVHQPLGEPPAWMNADQSAAWGTIAEEIPWLNGSHRALVEIAAYVRGRLAAGEGVGVQALNLLRQWLGQMGATPADASKAGAVFDKEAVVDPTDEFFQ
jgi:hypothetical protein